jgi:FkbM family methyltransferase
MTRDSLPEARLVETDVGPLYIDPADLSLGQKLLGSVDYEKPWTAWLRRAVARGTWAVDVGANIGYVTALLGELVGPEGRVLAIEPDPDNFALLNRNIERHDLGGRVVPVRAAVTDHTGVCTLYRDTRYHGEHSIASANVATKGERVTMEVPGVTLDEAIHEAGFEGRVGFVKIDVQGAEGLVLRGASRLLAQPRLSILLELWQRGLVNCGSSLDEVLDLIAGARFMPFRPSKAGEPRAVTYDALRARATGRESRWDSFNVVFVSKALHQEKQARAEAELMTTKSGGGRLSRLARSALRRVAGSPGQPGQDPRARDIVKAIKAQHNQLADIAARLERIEADLETLKTTTDKTFRRVVHVEPDVQAVLRTLHLDPESLPYPRRLTAHRFRLASQNQEDGVTLGLFKRIGPSTRRFVELGSGLSGGNSAVLALELGWKGLMVDGDAAHIAQVGRRFPGVTAVCAWITAEGANELIASNEFSGDIDLLSIDLDGNDYWVWKAITACNPRVAIVEYNSIFGAERAVTIPYDPKFQRSEHRFIYYGASLAALAALARQKGYRLVCTDTYGINAFFLRNDVGPEIPACTPAEAYRLLEKYDVLIQKKNVDIYRYAEEAGLALVDVS